MKTVVLKHTPGVSGYVSENENGIKETVYSGFEVEVTEENNKIFKHQMMIGSTNFLDSKRNIKSNEFYFGVL